MTFSNASVSPSPTYDTSGLRQALGKTTCLFGKLQFLINDCQYFVFVPILENMQKTRSAISCGKAVELRPELSSRPDW